MAEASAFLQRVREALGPARRPGGPAARREGEEAIPAGAARRAAPPQWQDLWQRFAKELEALGGQGHSAADAVEAAAVIAGVAERRGGKKIVTWDLGPLGLGAVAEALRGRGLEVLNASPPRAEAEKPDVRVKLRAALADADLGVTGADYAVAETGTLLLISGEGRSRLVSLLPRTHVALIRPGNLVPAMRDMAAILPADHAGGRAAAASCLNFITGPSRSADIEFVLARGVHGPGEVHVILIAKA